MNQVAAGGDDVVAATAPGAETEFFPYVAPAFMFALFTAAEPYVPVSVYPFVYALKIAAVTATLAAVYPRLRAIRPTRADVVPAVCVGIAVFVQWIALDRLVPYPQLGERVGFDPLSAFQAPAAVVAFVALRLFGLVVIVPLMEELFWRDFALRFLTDADLDLVPIGTFSARAFWLVTIAFALTHPEWVLALIAGAAYAGLLRWRRSVFAVILAHAVTNAALGAYILSTHDWRYW